VRDVAFGFTMVMIECNVLMNINVTLGEDMLPKTQPVETESGSILLAELMVITTGSTELTISTKTMFLCKLNRFKIKLIT